MFIVWNVILFFLAGAGLIWAAKLAVKQLNKLAHLLRFSEFVTAFVLMAVATTIPEFFVALSSIANGVQELALGDAIGSNIVDLTLIAGLIVLFGRGLPARGVLLRKDILAILGISFLPLLLGGDGQISRWDGILLFLVYGFYIWFQLRLMERFRKTLEAFKNGGLLSNLAIFIGAVVLLLVSSWLLVNSATFLADKLAVPQILIGMSLVALGTSIPELSFGIRALRENHPEMVLGDLLGAFAANIALILGVVATIAPISISSMSVFFVGAIALPIVIGIFLFICSTREKISWREALVLILLYISFVYIQTFFK